MDKTSELPTEILHQILSLLPTKTAARTAVLSKSWFKAYSTNPNLCFDESNFVDFRGQFLSLIDTTLERYRCDDNLSISAFNLCISLSDQSGGCDDLVDKWLDIITQKRASKISLFVKCESDSITERYNLLVDIILAMEFTQQLVLNHCNILLLKLTTLLHEDEIMCRNLKDITLCYVAVSESALDSLISCCPQIQMISLQYCIGFSGIRVSRNLPNLLSLSILCCTIVDVHIVDAPKMISFEYVNKGDSEPYLSQYMCLRTLKIGTCQNLRRVEFVKIAFGSRFLFEIIKKLHSIKELILHHCPYLRKMKIESSTLEVCSIGECDSLVQAVFDVPKLLSLAFSNQYRLPSLSFESASSQCRISINYDDILWDAEPFIHLRRYLVVLNDQVVDLAFGITSYRNRINKCLREASGVGHLPTPEVENLILSDHEYYLSELSYSTYFDDIFWTCSPKSLTVLQCSRRFRKFLRQQLLNNCHWRLTKCTWKDYLLYSQIEYKKRVEDDWVTLNRKKLRGNPRIIEDIHTIRFTQTQEQEKNKQSFISSANCVPSSLNFHIE
ncbi:unnamed protein product [Withania somnifera]